MSTVAAVQPYLCLGTTYNLGPSDIYLRISKSSERSHRSDRVHGLRSPTDCCEGAQRARARRDGLGLCARERTRVTSQIRASSCSPGLYPVCLDPSSQGTRAAASGKSKAGRNANRSKSPTAAQRSPAPGDMGSNIREGRERGCPRPSVASIIYTYIYIVFLLYNIHQHLSG